MLPAKQNNLVIGFAGRDDAANKPGGIHLNEQEFMQARPETR